MFVVVKRLDPVILIGVKSGDLGWPAVGAALSIHLPGVVLLW
jgi:hypothetical protein